jgi:hypothetical protein
MLAAGYLCLVQGAAAQEQNPCAEDRKRLCAGVEPGAGRMIKCLREKEKELSAACRDALARKKVDKAALPPACKADLDKQCPDAGSSPDKGLICLKEKRKALSPECRKAIKVLGEKGEPQKKGTDADGKKKSPPREKKSGP